jgi:hypothetical protein
MRDDDSCPKRNRKLRRERYLSHLCRRHSGRERALLVSNYVAPTLGLVFPYDTLLINLVGSFVVEFFIGVDNPNQWRSILAGACWGGWRLRVVHYVFWFRPRTRGLAQALAVGAHVHQLPGQYLALPESSVGRAGIGTSDVI